MQPISNEELSAVGPNLPDLRFGSHLGSRSLSMVFIEVGRACRYTVRSIPIRIGVFLRLKREFVAKPLFAFFIRGLISLYRTESSKLARLLEKRLQYLLSTRSDMAAVSPKCTLICLNYSAPI